MYSYFLMLAVLLVFDVNFSCRFEKNVNFWNFHRFVLQILHMDLYHNTSYMIVCNYMPHNANILVVNDAFNNM